MAINWTNCPNCGAAVDLEETKCPYCETPYPWKLTPTALPLDSKIDMLTEINRQLVAGIITPNEARASLGLPLKEG